MPRDAAPGPEIDWRSSCPVSSALDVLGDRWSLLIVRDLFIHGTRTYSEFLAADEGISTNILAARLRLLTGLGLIERADPQASARGNAYVLAEAGRALEPVLWAVTEWGQTHLAAFNETLIPVDPGPSAS